MTDLGTALKHEGMARVNKGANPEWKALFSLLVEKVARANLEFTADDIWDEYDKLPGSKPTTRDNRAFGPVMTRAMLAGVCRKAGKPQTFSRRPNLHRTPIEIWTSLICPRQGFTGL